MSPFAPLRWCPFVAGAALAALSTGCAHRVEVVSSPPGAMIRYDDAPAVATPATLRVPFGGARDVTVGLGGYRTTTARLPLRVTATGFLWDALTLRWRRARGAAPYTTLEVRLVEEHGGVGTWAPEEAGR